MGTSRRLSFFAICCVAVAGCGGSGGAVPQPLAAPTTAATASPTAAPTAAANSAALRFVHGSPDVGSVDVCIDSSSVSTAVAYKGFSGMIPIVGSVAHTVSIYATPATGTAGSECATAPQPFLGAAPLATTPINVAVTTRAYVVMGGRTGSSFGLFYYPSPASFVHSPTAPEALVFDASPTFGSVGVGYSDVSGASTIAAALVAPAASTATTSVTKAGSSLLVTPFTTENGPPHFYVGKPVTSGTVVPLVTEPAPPAATGNVYVADVLSIDSTNAAGVDVVIIFEPTVGVPY